MISNARQSRLLPFTRAAGRSNFLFRWIKQHLNLHKFMGKNDNAIRMQIIAAMIAYLRLRLARRLNSLPMLQLRFAELVCQRLFMRISIAQIDTPPPVNPSKPKPEFSPS